MHNFLLESVLCYLRITTNLLPITWNYNEVPKITTVDRGLIFVIVIKNKDTTTLHYLNEVTNILGIQNFYENNTFLCLQRFTE